MRIKRLCIVCGVDIDKRGGNAKYCKKCARKRSLKCIAKSSRKYYTQNSNMILKRTKKYRENNKERCKDYRRRYWKAMQIYKDEHNEKYGGNKKWQDIE